MTAVRDLTWRIAPGQRLVFEDMDDGVLLYDSLVGRTHLLNATAAETLTVLERNPGLTSDAIRRHVTEALDLPVDALPLSAVEELLDWFERLGILVAR